MFLINIKKATLYKVAFFVSGFSFTLFLLFLGGQKSLKDPNK
jgi:hypothetical protein